MVNSGTLHPTLHSYDMFSRADLGAIFWKSSKAEETTQSNVASDNAGLATSGAVKAKSPRSSQREDYLSSSSSSESPSAASAPPCMSWLVTTSMKCSLICEAKLASKSGVCCVMICFKAARSTTFCSYDKCLGLAQTPA